MLDLLMDLNRQFKTALVVVTHDLNIAAHMQHLWRMQDGKLIRET
jgi:lipoprotein-releasing system ATP-binding protein